MAAAAEGDQVRAARILLSFRNRALRERPEWVPMPLGEASSAGTAAVEVPERLPKRPRSGRRGSSGPWRKALAQVKGVLVVAAGSGAWSSGEEREYSPAPPGAKEGHAAAEAAADATFYYGAAAGSGPATSADDGAVRTQPRPLPAGEKAQAAKVSAAGPPAPKEPMAASSPETPLDFGMAAAAAGSGASSSWDDAARPQSKRKGHGARGSGGASSGEDEGCSSPAKRTRVADAGGKAAAVEEKPISSEPKMQSEPSTNRRDVGKFIIDLNMPWPGDDNCSDIC